MPHLKRKPSEYIREHVWWTTQPMEEPERREHLFEMIEWIGWDKLMFATDYPHWDFDDPSRVLPRRRQATPPSEAFYLGQRAAVRHDRGCAHDCRQVVPGREVPPGTRKIVDHRWARRSHLQRQGRVLRPAEPLPAQGAAAVRGPLIGLVRIRRTPARSNTRTRRDHPLPLARLGVRHPHRAILVRPQALPRARLRRQRRAGRDRGEGAVRRRDARRVGGARITS